MSWWTSSLKFIRLFEFNFELCVLSDKLDAKTIRRRHRSRTQPASGKNRISSGPRLRCEIANRVDGNVTSSGRIEAASVANVTGCLGISTSSLKPYFHPVNLPYGDAFRIITTLMMQEDPSCRAVLKRNIVIFSLHSWLAYFLFKKIGFNRDEW